MARLEKKRGESEGKGDTVTVDNNGKHKVEHQKELHSTAHTCTYTHFVTKRERESARAHEREEGERAFVNILYVYVHTWIHSHIQSLSSLYLSHHTHSTMASEKAKTAKSKTKCRGVLDSPELTGGRVRGKQTWTKKVRLV